MPLITFDIVENRWHACYPTERVRLLYDRPHTPYEVLTRKDGAWANVPPKDRLWTVAQSDELIPRRVWVLLLHFAFERHREFCQAAGRKSVERPEAAKQEYLLGLAEGTRKVEESFEYCCMSDPNRLLSSCLTSCLTSTGRAFGLPYGVYAELSRLTRWWYESDAAWDRYHEFVVNLIPEERYVAEESKAL